MTWYEIIERDGSRANFTPRQCIIEARHVPIAKRIVYFPLHDMTYSSSPLLDYCDDGIEENVVNDSVDSLIEIVSEVARRLF